MVVSFMVERLVGATTWKEEEEEARCGRGHEERLEREWRGHTQRKAVEDDEDVDDANGLKTRRPCFSESTFETEMVS